MKNPMKDFKLYEVAVVVAAVALGSTVISMDALAQRGGGHGGGSGHFGGGGAHFGGGRFGGGPRGGHVRGFGSPFFLGAPYSDYACSYDYNRPRQWRYDYCY